VPHSGFTIEGLLQSKNVEDGGRCRQSARRLAIAICPCQSARLFHIPEKPKVPQSLVIAVDGPAASGKGTIARALARHFGLPHMDTGLLYRAVALNLMRMGGDPSNEFAATRACDIAQIDLSDPELRSEAIGGIASRISTYPSVRAALLDRQRNFAAQPGGAVLDGRDVGTVIAPSAQVKLFVTASPEVRAGRRLRELDSRGMHAHFDEILADIRSRDARDAEREAAPLQKAPDALTLDTSDLDPDQSAARAIAMVEDAMKSG
jgi:cytidylate kinase